MIEYPDQAAMDIVFGVVHQRIHADRVAALVPFSRRGDKHTHLCAYRVKDLTCWEWVPAFEPHLRKNIPHAEVKICGSYEEIRRPEYAGRWNLVVIDNNLGGTDHPEDFDLFPAAYAALKDRAFICQCSSMLDPWGYWHCGNRRWNDQTLIDARRRFYGTTSEIVTAETHAAVHRRIAHAAGFDTGMELWMQRKHGLHYYLREVVRRKEAA